MNFEYNPQIIERLCRVCLTSSKNMIPLENPTEEGAVQLLLETVTASKLVINPGKLPSKVCSMCLSLLKLSYEFIVQFSNTQRILAESIHEPSIEAPLAPDQPCVGDVQLEVNGSTYNLNDIIVVVDDEEPVEAPSFEGFLRNLGTEVSATFVTKACEEPCEAPESPSKLLTLTSPVKAKELSPLPRKIECEFCSKTFKKHTNLELHREVCPAPSHQYVCDQCGHLMHSKSALYHHKVTHKGRQFKCHLCPKRYLTASHLRVHLNVHSNARSHLCSICGKSFNYPIALKYHMLLHEEKKHVCNICGLRYRMEYTLKRHIRTHTKEKPYQCQYCPKRFSSGGEKSAHERVHTGDRPYKCEFCGKGYIKADNLKYHYLTHTGDHECFLCGRTFIDIKFVKIHLKRHHDITDDLTDYTYLDVLSEPSEN